MEFTRELQTYLESSQEELKQLIQALCAIPAPSHHEERRAAFCKAWFEKNGFQDVSIDAALNVICPYKVTAGEPVTVFMAHTDTVFPDTKPMPFREENSKFYCPGVCDDTANLAVMMICARYFVKANYKPEGGILFVANSCEEGLGNLKGTRAIVASYPVRELVTFDGVTLNRIVNDAVGSHRYQITIKTEGGHSYSAFGNRNAIAYLAGMINTLYGVKVPQIGNSKTTYNVGLISGGTSVNTIAQEASILYEYRSDNVACLTRMKEIFYSVVAAYRTMGIAVDVELIGERPCAKGVAPEKHAALIARVEDSIRTILGQEPAYVSGSTDCNIPLSLGIPAIGLSACSGRYCHTREEELDLDSLPIACKLVAHFLCHYFKESL